MIAVDTNILVRFLTQDDQEQFERSYQLIQTQQIFIPDTVILETEWVLRFVYKFKPPEICQAFRNLFGLPNVHLSNEGLIAKVLEWHENGLDFGDALHLSQSQNCSAIYTFDEKFIRRGEGLTQCEIKAPD